MPIKKIGPEEITKILDNVDGFLARNLTKPENFRVTCVVCTHPDQRQINYEILTGKKNDQQVADYVGLRSKSAARNHRLLCLTNKGGAPIQQIDMIEYHRLQQFPTHANRRRQKLWILKELLLLRDFAMKQTPPDRRELFRLTQEIDRAAEDYHKAAAAQKAEWAKRRGKGADPLEEDLSPEQLQEMRLVGGENGRT